MNNFAALNMANIGCMQFLLEAEREYNAMEKTKIMLGEELAETREKNSRGTLSSVDEGAPPR